MSQSGLNASLETSPTPDIARRRAGLLPGGSLATTPYTYATNAKTYLHQPQTQTQQQQQPFQSQHHATFQEHANAVMGTSRSGDNAAESRSKGRRGSVIWSGQPVLEDDLLKQSRSPMMPQTTDPGTPPTMEELVRRKTSDSSSTRRSSLMQSDAVFSRPSTTRSSTTGNETEMFTQDDEGMLPGSLSICMTGKNTAPILGANRSRKLSFQLPMRLNSKGPPDQIQKRASVIEDPLVDRRSDNSTSSGLRPEYGGLAARRRIKMDLTLPIGPSDLSKVSNRKGIHPPVLHSTSPSRSRDFQPPGWGGDARAQSARTAPMMGERHNVADVRDVVATEETGVELEGDSALFSVATPSSTLSFVRPLQRIRDRCYTTLLHHRNGSRTQSDLDFTSTRDESRTSETPDGVTDQDAHVRDELPKLAITSKSTNTRRWPSKKSRTSDSDEHTQVTDWQRDSRKSISVNIFRRSHRFPEPSDDGKKEKKPKKIASAPWRREKKIDKPPLPSASLANMPIPPLFVPPGCTKVPSPAFDKDREVRGKLADFFFDTNVFPEAKRKQRASLSGYWDSNAVLMSMQTDIDLTKDEDDEGPEGRPSPAPVPPGPAIHQPGLVSSPGFRAGPGGYFTVGTLQPTPTPGAQDSWFRMHYSDRTPDVGPTVAALHEADERRKFEWLIPEHLPNSPLCPLHPKYVGPSKGLCYWHGRKSNGWGVEPRRDYDRDPMKIGQGKTRGWEVGEIPKPPPEPTKKRRLASFVE
ncbi:hypothetical protein G6514_005211 [Epicoccum nigrum]|nr:hypothetical protein G6514_005211 [Epicoccum nigrum]